MTTLYVPIALAAVGIVLRGAGFAFRKSIEALPARRAAGATFALSSVLTPFFMGTVVGAIAAGNVPAGGNGDAFSSWLQPLPLLIGAMFVATGAYLSAVFLVGDARRAGDGATWSATSSRRALAAAVVAGRSPPPSASSSCTPKRRYIFDRLIDQGLPLVIALRRSAGSALLAVLLRGGRAPALRPLAAGAVVAVIWGWGVAQFPYLLPTIAEDRPAAAPDPTLDVVFVVFAVAAVARPARARPALQAQPAGPARGVSE